MKDIKLTNKYLNGFKKPRSVMGSQSIWFQSQVWTSVCVYKHYHTVRPMFSPIFHPILMMVKETIFPVGTIHTLRQHNLDFFWPTHYVSINTVLNKDVFNLVWEGKIHGVETFAGDQLPSIPLTLICALKRHLISAWFVLCSAD